MTKNLIKQWMIVCLTVIVGFTFAVSDEEIQKIREAIPDKPVVQPEKERTMLVFSLCNGFKHSSVPYWAKALDVMSEKTEAFKVVHSSDMSVFSMESLKQFDVICLNNTTKLVPDEAQQNAIVDFIKSGKGIVGIHAATDNFYDWPEGMKIMGGVFKGHPWTADGTWAVKLDEPDHPLMKSFKGQNFKINDEIYRTEAPLYSRGIQRVLMSLDMSDSVTKNAKGVRSDDMDTGITWIKPVGEGRLFYCSLGHVHAVTWNSAVLEHVLAGIQYAMGDYKVDDTPLGQPKAKLDTSASDFSLDELKTFDWDKNRSGILKIQQLINANRNNPKELAKIEGQLVEALDSDISLASKDFICRQLATIGTKQAVPTLSKMLADKETSNVARFALEKIPGDAVDTVLLDTLKQTDQTDIQIGIITSFGVRGSDKAVSSLAPYAKSKDEAVAMAAIEALGTIGTAEAAEALNAVQTPSKQRAQDALLRCAKQLAQIGDEKAAEKIFRKMYSQENSSLIRAGALTGLIQVGSDDMQKLLSEAIEGDDVVIRQAAIRTLADVADEKVLKAIASNISNLSESVQVQLLAALAANPKRIGIYEALKLTKSEDQAVRIAAYRALAQIGDTTAVHLLAVASVEAPDRREREIAQDALYRISGDKIDKMILKKLKEANKTSSADKVTIQYIRSTVQRPVSGAVKLLVDMAMSDNRKLVSESIKALQSLAGPDEMDELIKILIAKPNSATETMVAVVGQKESNTGKRADALLDEYSDVSDEKTKASMLRVMGKLGDPDSVSLLRQEMGSDNSVIQEASFRAMADWPGNDFVEEMKNKALTGADAKTKILAFRAYVRMLDASGDDKNRKAVVNELIAAYDMAERTDEQKTVIRALGNHGTVAALKFVDAKMAEAELKAEAEVSLVNICEKLGEKNPQAVKSILDTLKDSKNETVKKKADKLFKTVSQYNDVVIDWKVSGPYKEKDKGVNALFDIQFDPEKDTNEVKWQDALPLLIKNGGGLFDLSRLAEGNDQVAYLKTIVSVEKDTPVVLQVGSDDGVKIWINGKQVHANNIGRAANIGDDKVHVTLEKGQNKILVKVTQGTGQWAFGVGIVDSKGHSVSSISVDAGN